MSIWNLLASVAVGAVAAVITATLALRRFRTERWWERKAQAYDQLMKQLADVEVYLSQIIAQEYGEKRLSEEHQKVLSAARRKAGRELRRAAAIGDFYVSDEVADAVEELVEQMDAAVGEDYLREFERHHSTVRKCISKVRDLGKRDLATARRWRIWI